MTLHVVQPPVGALRAAKTYLGRLRTGEGFLTRGELAASSHDELWLAGPHPVFNLSVCDIGLSDAIERVRMTGWRFFVLAHGQAVATLELAASRRREAGRFARVTDGRMAASAARAIARAEEGALATERRYALGMLRATSLGVSALWLRDCHEAPRHDLFAPVGSVPAQMTAERWLPAVLFLRTLRRLPQVTQLRRR